MSISVSDRDSLIRFLRELSVVSAEDDAAIVNTAIPTYLEAASGWVADMDGYFRQCGVATPTEPTWEMIALIFNAALSYD